MSTPWEWIEGAEKDFTLTWSTGKLVKPLVLPQAARVDWRKKPARVQGCGAWQRAGPEDLVTMCRRVRGHTGRHADIARNGVVRKVWGP